MKIKHVTVTPIAIKDPPLLNASGIHEPFALRSILEVETDNGRRWPRRKLRRCASACDASARRQRS